MGGDRHPSVDPRGGENRGGDSRRRNAPPAQNAQERDLSKLSFEDRMAYYKNKYGSDEAARAAAEQNDAASQSGPASQGGNRSRGPNPRRGNGGGSSEGRSDNRQGRQGGPASHGGQNRQDSGKPYAGRPKPAGEGGPAKSGGQNRPPRNGQGQGGKPGARPANPSPAARSAAAKPASASAQSVQKKEGGLGGLIKKLFGKK